MPYRDEPQPTPTREHDVGRPLAVLAGCALVFPAAGVIFALMPSSMRSSATFSFFLTWLMRGGFLVLGGAAVLLSRRLAGRAKSAALVGGIVVALWAVATTALHSLGSTGELRTYLLLSGVTAMLADFGLLAIVLAVGRIRETGQRDMGLALRACVAAVGGTLLQSLLWISGANPAREYSYWDGNLAVSELFIRLDNVFWSIPFVLLAIGALQRRRRGTIVPAAHASEREDDAAASSRTAASTEGLALFHVANGLIAAGTVTAIAIGVPALVLLAGTVVGGRPTSVVVAARTLVFPHGALLTALGMAFYETRRREASEAASGPRAFLALALLGVAFSDVLFYAGGWFDIARTFDVESIYAAWAFTAALAAVALAVVVTDVHRRARFALYRREETLEISNFTHRTDEVMRTASIAGGVAALSTACGQCSTTSSSTTTLWVVAGIAALAATIAAATAAKRARRLADRLEAFQR